MRRTIAGFVCIIFAVAWVLEATLSVAFAILDAESAVCTRHPRLS